MDMLFEPALAVEIPDQSQSDREHDQQYNPVSVVPGQFGHKAEIHAVDTGYQCQGHKDGGDDRQNAQAVVGSVLEQKQKVSIQFAQVVFNAFDIAQAVFHVRRHVVQRFADRVQVYEFDVLRQ